MREQLRRGVRWPSIAYCQPKRPRSWSPLVREIAQAELAPRAAADEAAGRFPRDAFALLGEVGLLGLPYPEEYGGAAQPYEVYLQALEEVASAWMTVGVGVSVHVMASYAMAAFGTPEQRASYLPEMIGGRMLGAYALSEAQAGIGHFCHDHPRQAC